MTQTMTHAEKSEACTLELISSGRAKVYEVTSPTSKTYKTVAHANGIVTCNCECGRRTHNSNCTHAERVRKEIQEEN